MTKKLIFKILIICSFISSIMYAQEATYIGQSATMHAEKGALISILGDLKVDGIFNTAKAGGTQPIIYLKGNTITIDTTTGDMRSFPTTDDGGLFVFQANAPQTLAGGSTAFTDINSFFPNIELDNANNLTLSGSAGASKSFKFTNGKVLTSTHDFSIGTTTDAGNLIGYDNTKFFVVNGNTTNDSKGFLARFATANTDVDFPVGTNTSLYEPASIKATANPAQMKVRVFSGVFGDGYSTAPTTERSCGFTWDIHPTTAAIPTVDLTLAHTEANEGALYNSAVDKTAEYIAHYVGTLPNTAGGLTSYSKWDRLTTGAASIDGTISGTGATYNQHTRTGISSFSPFSKALNTDIAPLPLKSIVLEAVAKNNSYAALQWKIEGEYNVERYDIKKSENINLDMHYLSSMPASNQAIYGYDDHNVEQGKVYYYQIVAVDKGTNNKTISNIASAKFTKDGGTVIVYPNPSRDILNVSYSSSTSAELNINLVNNLGQSVATQKINTNGTPVDTAFDVTQFASGTYVIVVENVTANTQESIKVKISN